MVKIQDFDVIINKKKYQQGLPGLECDYLIRRLEAIIIIVLKSSTKLPRECQ